MSQNTVTDQGAPTQPEAPQDVVSPGRARYILFILTLTYALSFLDRNLINILIEPIKRELGLSDTVMGLLSGFGFLLLYSIVAVPIGHLADKKSRVGILSLGLLVWSGATALSGAARSVAQLAVARIGVGIGESASNAPAHSLIADYFPGAKRARAMAIYATGIYVGVFLGYAVGGVINHTWGWRAAFMFPGLAGVVVALLVWLTVKEPPRGQVAAAQAQPAAPLCASLRFLFSQKTYLWIILGFSLTSYTNYSFSVWIPSFLKRVHHLSSAEIGLYAGTIKGLVGIAGALLGGLIVERLGKKSLKAGLVAPALASALGFPALMLFLTSSSVTSALFFLGLGSLLIAFHLGPIWAFAQHVVKADTRALAASVLLLTANLIGLGVGPMAIGMINDHMAARLGMEAIRYSLMTGAIASLLGGLCFLVATRHARRDIEKCAE